MATCESHACRAFPLPRPPARQRSGGAYRDSLRIMQRPRTAKLDLFFQLCTRSTHKRAFVHEVGQRDNCSCVVVNRSSVEQHRSVPQKTINNHHRPFGEATWSAPEASAPRVVVCKSEAWVRRGRGPIASSACHGVTWTGRELLLPQGRRPSPVDVPPRAKAHHLPPINFTPPTAQPGQIALAKSVNLAIAGSLRGPTRRSGQVPAAERTMARSGDARRFTLRVLHFLASHGTWDWHDTLRK